MPDSPLGYRKRDEMFSFYQGAGNKGKMQIVILSGLLLAVP